MTRPEVERLAADRRHRVRRMRERGMTFEAIAAELGVSYQRAQQLARPERTEAPAAPSTGARITWTGTVAEYLAARVARVEECFEAAKNPCSSVPRQKGMMVDS